LDPKAKGNKNIPIAHSGADWGIHHQWDWNGYKCHWRFIGDINHQAIVLIHGFGASSAHWRNNAKDFANEGFCVYGLDLVGFGKSEQPEKNKTKYLDNHCWSNQLESFLEEIVLINKSNKAILIGNSLGGLVALTTITFRPDLVKGIIAAPLPDPAFLQKTIPYKRKYRKRINQFFLKIFFQLLPLEIIVPLISRTKLIDFALQFAYSRSISLDNELKKIIKDPAKKRTAAQALRAMCIGMALRPKSITAPDLLNKLSAKFIKPPILLIWGQEDKLIPLFLGKKVLRQHPWIKLLVVDKCGHCPHDESPKFFNDSVLNWLKMNFKSL
tara:strand:- start:1489 stop:2469 length:981 start_codon:yes stop_codon:yes gene_type:complete